MSIHFYRSPGCAVRWLNRWPMFLVAMSMMVQITECNVDRHHSIGNRWFVSVVCTDHRWRFHVQCRSPLIHRFHVRSGSRQASRSAWSARGGRSARGKRSALLSWRTKPQIHHSVLGAALGAWRPLTLISHVWSESRNDVRADTSNIIKPFYIWRRKGVCWGLSVLFLRSTANPAWTG